MQFASRTLQQLLVLSVAVLIPIECACIPVTLPDLTSATVATATTSAASAMLSPIAIQLLGAQKSSAVVSSAVKATSSAGAVLRPAFGTPVATTATTSVKSSINTPLAITAVTSTKSSSVAPVATTASISAKSSIRSTSSSKTVSASPSATIAVSGRPAFGKTNTKRAEVAVSKHTAHGRAILKEQAEARELAQAATEKSLEASAATLKFGSAKSSDLLSHVVFGATTMKKENPMISNLRLSLSKAVEPLVKSLTFQRRSPESATTSLQFGINREQEQLVSM